MLCPDGGKWWQRNLLPATSLDDSIRTLEEAIARKPEGDTKRKMQSALRLIHSTMQSAQQRPPHEDTIASLTSIPAALIHVRPPTMQGTIGLDAAWTDALVQTPPRLPPELARRTRSWHFNLHEIPATELPALCYGVMIEHPEFERFNLRRLWRYVQEVSYRYHDNPFHSFRHAVDVTICTSFLTRAVQRQHERSFRNANLVVALIVAAMFHDTDHPGVMNSYLVKTRHPLALLYNEQSVLENHHVSTALALLEQPELNFMGGLPLEEQREMRGWMIDLVLATDVTTHVASLKEFVGAMSEHGTSGTGAGGTLPDTMVMKMVIKASDISNPARSLPIFEEWMRGIMQEFYAQGDAERSLGLPISMNCDRHTVSIPAAQVGFIKFLIMPLYNGLEEFVPELRSVVCSTLESNLAHFTELAAQKKLEA